MRGGALPPALLAAALGFALAFATRRALAPALVGFAVIALAVSCLRPPQAWHDAVFLGGWTSIVLTALMVHLRTAPDLQLAGLLAANAGIWSGAMIGAAGQPLDLAKALPWALLCLPGRWLVAHRWQIGLKVVASWLVAVAVLAATIPMTTRTPGYVADHME